jgi:thioredoxin reductase (NADPH)
MNEKMYDVIIIGGGPAGLTAGIYCSRRGLATLLITKDIGGQITRTGEIENYPGLEKVSGTELAKKLFDQAKKFGTEILFDEAKEIKKDKKFTVKTIREIYQAKSIILAFGKKPRELNVPGEENLKGRGVTYCATCDAPFFKDKNVCVVGGGNSALEATIVSAAVAKKVYLIYRGNEFRGEEALLQQVKGLKNIEILMNEEVSEIIGEAKVESVKLKSGKNLATDGVIVEIGFIIDRSLIQGLVDMDQINQVIVDGRQSTSIEGIFAAGDLTQTPVKQIVVSAGEGAKAALSCFDYIQRLEGKKGILADWH